MNIASSIKTSTRLRNYRFFLLCLILLPFSSTFAMPDGAKAVTNFSLERYLGFTTDELIYPQRDTSEN
jgi:hypothetical protein